MPIYFLTHYELQYFLTKCSNYLKNVFMSCYSIMHDNVQSVSYRSTSIVRLKEDPWLNLLHFSLELFYFSFRVFSCVPLELQSGGMKENTECSKS